MITSSFMSAGPSASAGLIVLSLSAGFLLPVILNTTKLFYIQKPVTSVDSTTATKILKGKI